MFELIIAILAFVGSVVALALAVVGGVAACAFGMYLFERRQSKRLRQ